MLSYTPKDVSKPASVKSHESNHSGAHHSASTPNNSNANNATDQMIESSSAFRFVSYARQTWAERRPWSEFYSTRALSRPQFADLSERFGTNLHIYRANYQIIAAFWLFVLLLGHMFTLVMTAVLSLILERGSTFLAAKHGGSLPPKFKIIVAILVLLIIWVTDIGKFVIWSLSLTGVSVALHATFHVPQIETEIV